MDKNKEHRDIGSEDFRRYRSGEMTGEERNAFEKELQKDPFSEEASEGFLLVTANQADEDLKTLGKKLAERTGRRSAVIYYRAAAAVAIVVTVSVIFFNRSRETEVMLSKSEKNPTETPVSIAASEPIKDLSEKEVSKNGPAIRSQQPTTSLPISPSPSPPVSPSPLNADTDQSVKSAEEKTDTRDLVKEEELIAADAEEVARDDESEKKMEYSKVAGVSAPMAAKGRSATEYTKAMPLPGIDSFNLYIEKYIRIPDTTANLEQTVIISFIVNTDSTLSDFRIIESPGQSFSREAKRLIKEGPRWKPATENGLPVSEETRIKIVFR